MLDRTKRHLLKRFRAMLFGVATSAKRAACTCGLKVPQDRGVDATASFALVL